MRDEQMNKRFRDVMDSALRQGERAILQYGSAAQEAKALEEMGELLTAYGRISWRGSPEDIVDECADVMITVLQLAMIYGGVEQLIQRIGLKSSRLEQRIDEAERRRNNET